MLQPWHEEVEQIASSTGRLGLPNKEAILISLTNSCATGERCFGPTNRALLSSCKIHWSASEMDSLEVSIDSEVFPLQGRLSQPTDVGC